jgi:hypothetical protein
MRAKLTPQLAAKIAVILFREIRDLESFVWIAVLFAHRHEHDSDYKDCKTLRQALRREELNLAPRLTRLLKGVELADEDQLKQLLAAATTAVKLAETNKAAAPSDAAVREWKRYFQIELLRRQLEGWLQAKCKSLLGEWGFRFLWILLVDGNESAIDRALGLNINTSQRTRRRMETHLRWAGLSRKGFSDGQIAKLHNSKTGERITRDAVRKGRKRVQHLLTSDL